MLSNIEGSTLANLRRLSQTGPPWFSHEIRTVGEALPALLDVVERVEKLERLAETVQAVIEDSDTVGGPTWVPVSKGVFEAMREALAALDGGGPS